jgi:dTDP-4-dehydrorhamnose reductase
MRAVVIGKMGQLALCLAESMPPGVALACLGRRELDMASPSPDFGVLASFRPDIVINAAAYTAVDKAESDQQAAFALNANGPALLAAFTASRDIPLIHISTDYVFDGTASRPYVETDAPNPLNVYGQSKLDGERAVLDAQAECVILRTSWLFSAHGGNFVKTMLRLARERDHLRIVGDQFGCPTSAHELAKCIWIIARRIHDGGQPLRDWGTYHYAGAGPTTWADFAAAIFASPEACLPRIPIIDVVPTQDYPLPAARPRNSALDCNKISACLGLRAPPWQASLAGVLGRLHTGAHA